MFLFFYCKEGAAGNCFLELESNFVPSKLSKVLDPIIKCTEICVYINDESPRIVISFTENVGYFFPLL